MKELGATVMSERQAEVLCGIKLGPGDEATMTTAVCFRFLHHVSSCIDAPNWPGLISKAMSQEEFGVSCASIANARTGVVTDRETGG
eukprot:6488805-Amphidinium_carterae.1